MANTLTWCDKEFITVVKFSTLVINAQSVTYSYLYPNQIFERSVGAYPSLLYQTFSTLANTLAYCSMVKSFIVEAF